MWKIFAPVAIVVAVVAGAIVWKVRHHTNPTSAHHHERCPPMAASVQRPPAAPAHVSGHVTKKTGAAVAGATVALVPTGLASDLIGDSAPLVATTDASGAWSIENVPPGDYVGSASASGFLPMNTTRIAIAAGENHAGIDMSLEAGGGLVRGIVSDYDGKPIGGARVEASDGSEMHAPCVVLTGADGKYELSLPDGKHWFTVGKDDFTRTHESVEVEVEGQVVSKPQSVDFKLVRGGTIRGVVVARATGKPVPGAIVDASKGPDPYWHGQAIAGDDGTFILPGASDGVVSLEAFADGVASAQPMHVGVGIGEQIDGVRVLVDPAASICGRVVAKGTRNGIAGANVLATSAGGSVKSGSD
ncbi:MAG TPA: carboxypeptidase-like regulatory domain-containing protein, partial [Kofleriaceae bacterium]|nr:carboxypeptidase-like regulatory domain-containing protein [Kofleriaceae bacterium]